MKYIIYGILLHVWQFPKLFNSFLELVKKKTGGFTAYRKQRKLKQWVEFRKEIKKDFWKI